MIVVTGGAGFIGSNLIKGLNLQGLDQILLVDFEPLNQKSTIISECIFQDHLNPAQFLKKFSNHSFFPKIDAIFHQGACTDTLEKNEDYLMAVNFEYSKTLFTLCVKQKIPLIYASSAAVYGNKEICKEELCENPLNIYGLSKLRMDQWVRSFQGSFQSQVTGLRYFNVYGPGEGHKGKMASVVWQFNEQLLKTGEVKLFGAWDGYENGEQRRDFINVEDIVDINLWFLANNHLSGIYNCGTGCSYTFNEIAQKIIDYHGFGKITYIEFPPYLKECYQNNTQADLALLKKVGYRRKFKNIEQGIGEYLRMINHSN